VKARQEPSQRPTDARLLVVDARGRIAHAPRAAFVSYLRRGDLVIANDAATMPASLHGVHAPSGGAIEVRLAQRSSLAPTDVRWFTAVVFGAGDFRTRTEDRPLPPVMAAGDRLQLGPLSATVDASLGHPRLVRLRFEHEPAAFWAALARNGRPVQYSHMPSPLALWDVWTRIASAPVAFEPPSAGFILDWAAIHAMRDRGVAFAAITLAAGLSSTGDPELDRSLPLDEPYRISERTAGSVFEAKARGGRIVAIGTSVVRALEHAAVTGTVLPGEKVATQRLGRQSELHVVDAIVSGTHEPGTSHYELLRAFIDEATLGRADGELEAHGYRTHEFGDSVLMESMAPKSRRRGRFRPPATAHVGLGLHACAGKNPEYAVAAC
jgi:S-adenosylmethionine:tRNA ribosyltransferase-isomerase